METNKETKVKEVFISEFGKSIKPDENGQRRNLAFYKESGEDWTEEEFINVCNYVGEIDLLFFETDVDFKWLFDDYSEDNGFMYFWDDQDDNPNFSKCRQLSYESIFLNQEQSYDDLILNPDVEITDKTVIKVESQEQFDKVCEEFEIIYKLSFNEMWVREGDTDNPIAILPKYEEWCDSEYFQHNGFTVLDFNEVFIQPNTQSSSQEIKEVEIKEGTIVKAIRYEEKEDYIVQTTYYGKCSNGKHLVAFNGTHCMIVDKVEKLPTLTKKEAKQRVSELFANPNKVSSQQIRDIIDLVGEQ